MGLNRASKERPLDATSASREELLNLALDINLEWGPELGRPEALRMTERTSDLAPGQAEELTSEAGKASALANGIVNADWGDGSHAAELTARARVAVMEAHPWVDDDNMEHLLSQACYYAWHG